MRGRSAHRHWRGALASLLVALAIAIASLGAGCGGSESHDAVLIVATGSAPEEAILGHIYAQSLEDAGYTVKRRIGINSVLLSGELEDGLISGYPEHLIDVLQSLVGLTPIEAPADPTQAYEKAKTELRKSGLTAFPPAPFQYSYALGMLRKEADARGLKTLSNLVSHKGESERMTVEGPAGCHVNTNCLGGLEVHYGLQFKYFFRTDPPQRYKVLEDGKTDTSMLFTTDGQLSAEKGKFTILEDDKHRFSAGNVIWMTTPKVAEEAGPDYEKTIVEAQRGLTLPVMQELNAKVELEGQPAAKVALEYLAK
jgi:glycine betaine/choline ABC-type transport system substrate-binding protein